MFKLKLSGTIQFNFAIDIFNGSMKAMSTGQ
jgi:hypothetical protein